MSYSELLNIDPQLARRLQRRATSPGEAYWCAGRLNERKYRAISSDMWMYRTPVPAREAARRAAEAA